MRTRTANYEHAIMPCILRVFLLSLIILFGALYFSFTVWLAGSGAKMSGFKKERDALSVSQKKLLLEITAEEALAEVALNAQELDLVATEEAFLYLRRPSLQSIAVKR